jgi:prefoldin subunit 5
MDNNVTSDMAENVASLIAETEQVLHRLVNERRALENGARLLAAYRTAVSELDRTCKELAQTQHELDNAKTALNEFKATSEQAVRSFDEQFNAYKNQRSGELQAEIDALLAQRTLLMVENSNVLQSIEAAKHTYEEMRANQTEDYQTMLARLNAMQAQYNILTTAIQHANEVIKQS